MVTRKRYAASGRGRRHPGDALAAAFVAESRRRLRAEYLPKIRVAVATLGARNLWWRPNSRSNSAGHLLLHLEGNLRQWIVHGLGGAADVRRRSAEFEPHAAPPARLLLARLERARREADAVLARLRPADLLARRTIQGYRVTGMQAVYHVVEHFSGHTGQILYLAKLRRGVDLALYPHLGPARGATGRRRRGRQAPRRFF
jgi:uncharacterized damage-inducible protein DinB